MTSQRVIVYTVAKRLTANVGRFVTDELTVLARRDTETLRLEGDENAIVQIPFEERMHLPVHRVCRRLPGKGAETHVFCVEPELLEILEAPFKQQLAYAKERLGVKQREYVRLRVEMGKLSQENRETLARLSVILNKITFFSRLPFWKRAFIALFNPSSIALEQ